MFYNFLLENQFCAYYISSILFIMLEFNCHDPKLYELNQILYFEILVKIVVDASWKYRNGIILYVF